MNTRDQQLLGIGLIGIGPHARENLIPALQNNPDARITAVCSRQRDRMNDLKSRYQARHGFQDFNDLVHCDAVDAVVTAGPPELHETVLHACLLAGKHVFVEKPPARSCAELSKLIALSETKPDVVTFVDYSFRFGAPYLSLLEALSGDGEVTGARIRCVSSKPTDIMWADECVEQSFLLAIAIHPIAMIIDLFGKVRDVAASQVNLSGNRFMMDVTFTFTSGAVATLQLGNYATRFEFDVELITRNGAVGQLQQQRKIVLSGSVTSQEAQSALGPKAMVELDWPSLRGGYAVGGYQNAVDAFVREAGDRQAKLSPLYQSAPILRSIDAILVTLGHPALGGRISTPGVAEPRMRPATGYKNPSPT